MEDDVIPKYNLKSILQESKVLISLSLPVMFSSGCRMGMVITASIFLSRYGEKAMSAAIISDSFAMGLNFFVIGLLFALDTFVSQAFGAKNFKQIGIAYQTSLLLSVLLSIPILIILYFTEQIMLLLQQDPEISKLCGQYIVYTMPGTIPLFFWRATERYLNCQKILSPGVYAGIIGFVMNIFFCYLFMNVFDLGFKGAPLANTTSRFLQVFLLWGIIYWKGIYKGNCDKIHKEAFTLQQILNYLKIGFPSAVWYFFESMGWNVVTILVGTLKNEYSLAAHAIGSNLVRFSYIPVQGYSMGTRTRVGIYIGEKKPENANFSAKVSIVLFSTLILIQGIIICIFGNWIIKIWSDNEKVLSIAIVLLFLSQFENLIDSLQTICVSIIVAIGKQKIGAYTNLCHWIIGLPSGLILVKISNLDIYSFWITYIFSLTLIFVILLIYVFKIDWEKEVENAFKRMDETEKMVEKEELANLVETNQDDKKDENNKVEENKKEDKKSDSDSDLILSNDE